MTEAYYSPLIGKKLMEGIVYHAQPHLVYDKMTIGVNSDKGVYEYMKMTNSENLTFKSLAPGAALENDVLKFDKNPIVIDEDGVAPRIPMSTIDDQNVDILSEVSKELGRSYSKKLNSDFMTVGNAGVYASNTSAPGTVWSADGGTPFRNMMTLQNYLADDNYVMDTVAINPSARLWLMSDPDYMVQAPRSKEQVEGYKATDPLPILGATMYNTTQQTDGTVLAVDSQMYCLSIQREPLTVQLEKEPGARQMIVNAWMRHKFAVIRSKAGATLTSVI